MRSQTLINILLAALRANPSLGELQAKIVLLKIRSFINSGMNENEVIDEVIKIQQ